MAQDEIQRERIEMGTDDSQDVVDGRVRKNGNAFDSFDDDDDSDDEGDDEDLFDDDEDDESSDDDEDGDEDANEDDEDDSGSRHSRRGISPKKYGRVRSREAHERAARKAGEAKIAELESQLKEVQEAADAKPAISDDDIRAEAAQMVVFPTNATEDQKKQILATAEAQLRRVINLVAKGQKPPKELASLQTTVSELRDQQIFNEEWDDFADDVASREYPSATPRQYRLARRAMDKLAHAPKFADKDFEFVWYKNRDIFDQIFRKSRTHTFEQRGAVRGRQDRDENNRGSRTSAKDLTPKELEKRNSQMEKQAQSEDQRSGWNVMNPDGSSVE